MSGSQHSNRRMPPSPSLARRRARMVPCPFWLGIFSMTARDLASLRRPMTRLRSHLVCLLLLMTLVWLPLPGIAQETAPASYGVLADLLENPQSRDQLIQELRRLAGDPPVAPAATPTRSLLDVELPSEGGDTLGGFIYSQLGKVPSVGAEVHFAHVTMRVLSVDGNRIDQVRAWIEKSPPEAPPGVEPAQDPPLIQPLGANRPHPAS